MKWQKKTAVPLCCAALMLLTAVGLECWSVHGFSGQIHQLAAERWDSDGTLPCGQVSVFFSRESALPASNLESIHKSIEQSMKAASLSPKNEDAALWYDAWSTEQGTVHVRGAKTQETEALASAVGGDFFRIHPLHLLSGGYICPDDLMQDRVMIDDLLAWYVFGSPDVAGMELTVDGKVYQIAGVVETAQDRITQTAYGKKPRVYLPFFGTGSEETGSEDGNSADIRITCYEAVLPNPVRGFSEKTVTEAIGTHDPMQILVNTRRGSLTRRWQNLKQLRNFAISADGIAYPWWENAARIRDFSAAQRLCTEICLLVFPALCLLALIWKGYRFLEHFIAEKREKRKRRYRTIEKDPYSI